MTDASYRVQNRSVCPLRSKGGISSGCVMKGYHPRWGKGRSGVGYRRGRIGSFPFGPIMADSREPFFNQNVFSVHFEANQRIPNAPRGSGGLTEVPLACRPDMSTAVVRMYVGTACSRGYTPQTDGQWQPTAVTSRTFQEQNFTALVKINATATSSRPRYASA